MYNFADRYLYALKGYCGHKMQKTSVEVSSSTIETLHGHRSQTSEDVIPIDEQALYAMELVPVDEYDELLPEMAELAKSYLRYFLYLCVQVMT